MGNSPMSAMQNMFQGCMEMMKRKAESDAGGPMKVPRVMAPPVMPTSGVSIRPPMKPMMVSAPGRPIIMSSPMMDMSSPPAQESVIIDSDITTAFAKAPAGSFAPASGVEDVGGIAGLPALEEPSYKSEDVTMTAV